MHNNSPEAILDAFLAALADVEGGGALLAMHTDDALVRYAEGVCPAAQANPSQFAETHRALSLQGQDALPQFRREGLLNAGDGVAWFEVIETRGQSRLVLALGTREARVGWCTLAPRVADWSYRDGLLHAVADYPWMRTTEPARARALLEASYFRQHWRSPVTFSTLPNARFSCQMSTDCCRHDFEITLPPEAQQVVDAMPWERLRPELVGTRLPLRPDGKLQLKALNETCRFLGPQSQCLIHQTLGRQPFGPCSVFPFAFARTPDGVAVGMSPICGATRRGLGVALTEREEDLRERLAQAEPRRPEEGFRLAPGTDIQWEQFRDTEKVLCDILGAQELPLRRRLYVGTRLLGALKDNETVDMNRWLAEPPVAITAELREAIRGMLIRVLGWDRATLQALPQTIPENLARLEVLDAPVVVRILQNTLFCKTYSYPYDLTTAYNFLIVLYLLTLTMQEASHGTLSDAMWRELGSLGVHGLLKSVLHEGVPEGFRNLFGTAEFGQWLLVA
jgi:hypothetical protein